MLGWCASLLVALAAIACRAIRFRGRGMAMVLLTLPGCVLMFAGVAASIGLAEGVWTGRSLAFWVFVGIGLSGLGLMTIGVRSALERPIPAGHCRGCGYDLAGLAVCPECGRSSA